MNEDSWMLLGPIKGYKALALKQGTVIFGDRETNKIEEHKALVLRSPMYSGSIWYPTGKSLESAELNYHEAVCRNSTLYSPRRQKEWGEPHVVPNPDCDCGYWAYHSTHVAKCDTRISDIIWHTLGQPTFVNSHEGVLALVWGWGEGLLTNKDSFRSRYMSIAALCSYSNVDTEALEKVSDALNVPLLDKPEFLEYAHEAEGLFIPDFKEPKVKE